MGHEKKDLYAALALSSSLSDFFSHACEADEPHCTLSNNSMHAFEGVLLGNPSLIHLIDALLPPQHTLFQFSL
jgi:hypothetical protein